MSLIERLAEVDRSGERAVLLTVVDGDRAGAKLLVREDGAVLAGDGPPELAAAAAEVIRGARNQLLELDDRRVFAEVYMPPPRLLVYGAVDVAEPLCRAARALGWTTIVADARARFATAERIPSAHELIVAWPEEAFAQVRPDHQTAVVILTHDAKFDQPALVAALAGESFYIGALGSRRTQEKRRARLLEAGVEEAALGRIAGPCGLDLGADTREETALSIIAEVVAARRGREGGALRHAKRRIHAGAG